MNLSKRLQKIADFVPGDTTVCDIGTDHGYIPVYLIKSNISKKVIGTDISKGSLVKIIDLVKKEKLQTSIDVRLGDGLDILKPNEVDTLIIAGMGGILISEILKKGKDLLASIENFILQPMIGAEELRRYLIENNFQIVDEELVFEEGKYYEIIFAKKGQGQIDKDIYYEISEILIKNKHPLIKPFVEYKKNKIKNIMDDIKFIDTERSIDKYNKLKLCLNQYQEVLKEIDS